MRNDVSSLAQLTTHSRSKDRRGVANFFEASEHVPSVRRFDFSACLAPACRQPTDRLGSAPHRSLFFGIIATFCTSLIHPTTSTMSCFNGASRSLRSRSKKKRNEAGCLRKMRHIWWCAGLHFHLHGGIRHWLSMKLLMEHKKFQLGSRLMLHGATLVVFDDCNLI